MKKVIKLLLVFCILLFPFLFISQKFFVELFSFNYLSLKSWGLISKFLDSGGTIKGTQDYLLLASLALNPILFLTLWRFFYKKSFINLILYPINTYNKRMLQKYNENTKSITLKNMGRTTGAKKELEELKPNLEASKNAPQSIREAVREKLTNN